MNPKLFLSVLVVALSTYFTLTLKADAGGIEQPKTETETNTSDKALISAVATPKFTIWGNWEIWSNPYLLNGNICREKAGNVICLTPQQAKNTRWNITSKSGN
ncbi:MAG: hypothetical protein U7123_06080 [Potamolinea sp.]